MLSVIKEKPSAYLKRIWYDTVVYDQGALEMCIAVAGSPDRVLYGSDYPHNIGDMEGCLARVDALPGRAGEAGEGSGGAGVVQALRSRRARSPSPGGGRPASAEGP